MDSLIQIAEILFFLLVMYKLIYEKDKEDCFYWYLYGCILLYPLIKLPVLPWPPVLLPLICILRSYKDKELQSQWCKYPLRIVTFILFIYHIIHPFISSWMPLSSAFRFELYELSQTYLVVLGGYLIAPDCISKKKFQRNILIIAGVLIISGVLCWLLQKNFIADGASRVGESYFNSEWSDTTRGFRVTGTQFSPNVYGNALVLCILLINHYVKNKIKKILFILGLLLCIVFTATRTPLIILILGLCVYYLFQNKAKFVSAILFVGLAFVLFKDILLNNEYIGRYVEGIIDLFLTGGENTQGSSADLRELQWLTTLRYLEEAPIWGHGEGYTLQMTSESGRFFALKDSDLAGAEGYQYITLIDYGISYMLLVLLFFSILLTYFIYNIYKKRCKEMAMWGLCFTICLFVFLLSSRPNQIWQIYFPFIGLCLKCIVNQKVRCKL